MKRFYTVSLVLLIICSLAMIAEMFDVVVPPVWLSQVNGLLLVLSLFAVTYIRVRRCVPRYR